MRRILDFGFRSVGSENPKSKILKLVAMTELSSIVGRTLSELRAVVACGPPYDDGLLASLREDPRAGARALHGACLRGEERARLEESRIEGMFEFEREAAANGFKRVAGVDETGRGPLAGPIVAAAVVLAGPLASPFAGPLAGLNDSKQLTAARRDELFDALHEGGHDIGVALIDAKTVDAHGIQAANYGAMAEAVAQLSAPPDFLLVDGFTIQGCPLPQKRLVKGDCRSMSIAAASIVAKVTRDRLMDALDAQYPGYGLAKHKGYGTREHLDALRRLGPCPIHRASFARVSDAAETGLLFDS